MIMRPVLGEEFDPTGVEDIHASDNQLLTYPNPNRSGILNIKVTGVQYQQRMSSGEILIYNVYGQLLKDLPFKNQINISDLANGMYLIRFRDDQTGQVLSGKFMVNR